ncbi:MAG: TonB-dependent receptor [Rhodospirillales bacterium]|nr:TonB-dependent receptor [Rhodospirillales bacterium]
MGCTVATGSRCRGVAAPAISKVRSTGGRARAALIGAMLGLAPALVAAQIAAPDATTLPTIEVIGTSPLLGTGIDRDKVPGATRSMSESDLRREGTPDLVGTLNRQVPGVSINDVQANPFQPDVQFRGFDASPVQGTPQGLAIYQNGVRINEAFGDTVNWDLIPDVAIDRVNLVGANPVFGLNALGGALAVEMKNGFTYEGGEATLSGGSFGRHEASIEYGVRSGNVASYVAARGLDEDGWRWKSPSHLRQIYADLGARGERLTAHLSVSGASNRLAAIGPTPVELLAVDRAAIFTYPQTAQNELLFFTGTGSYRASDTLTLDGNLYRRSLRQDTVNGNASDVQSCDPGLHPGFLCFGDATTLLFGTNGAPVPDTLGGATPGSLDRTSTHTTGYGGSLQATETEPFLTRENHLVVGASIDRGEVDFAASNELGIIDPSLAVIGIGTIVAQPDGSVTPVRIKATNTYYGLYLSDTWNATPALALTAGGRYNIAMIRIADQLGAALNGSHRFSRFNPAAGATYKLTSEVTAYAGYSEANRAPTAAELACADPARPCSLDNFLVSDPPLKQVVAHSIELGLRGSRPVEDDGKLSWNLGVFRTESDDDIINVASTVTGRGFFQNAGTTLRQGIEAGLSYRDARWFVHADYSLVDATFQSSLTLNSPANPQASPDGTIQVRPGDHLPGIPQHRLKLGADYTILPAWIFGGDLIAASSQYLRGDESNRNPLISGYAVVNLHSSYRIREKIEIFGLVQNLFDQKYETFGVFVDTTRVPSLNLTNPRSLSPGAPLAVFGGLRIGF